MTLPIVLEIAIGLIFIYLTLSLVASEIQEILSALFQWRAEHLKRSIEQLLAGEGTSQKTVRQKTARQNAQAAKALANRLYNSPLIENLNYEAQGRIARWFRAILHGIGALYRTLTFSRNVFDNRTSAPSYIPAETFAASLVESLKLADFQQLLVRSRFSNFAQNDLQRPLHHIVHELRAQSGREDVLAAELAHFDRQLQQIVSDLAAQRIPLESALQQLSIELHTFESMADDGPLSNNQLSNQLFNPMSNAQASALVQSFFKRVHYLHNSIDGQSPKHTALIARIRPSLEDLIALLDPNSATYAELVAVAQREGGIVLGALEQLQQQTIPPRLRESLLALGAQAQRRITPTVQIAGAELQQFQAEIENWFNLGMERASGVYRRNVKGVGLLVGLAIAFILNADTLYMYQRLSTDQAIRSSIVQSADQLEVRGVNSPEAIAQDLSIDELSEQIGGDLRSVGLAVEETLADYPLPIGRTPKVLAAQQAAEANWPIPLIPQRLIGWAITALALSMGASFWFDLLRKVTSVRATGNPPKE
ncbi:MAG: hypothetical protein WBA76_11425 [Phormidesmis sp.]